MEKKKKTQKRKAKVFWPPLARDLVQRDIEYFSKKENEPQFVNAPQTTSLSKQSAGSEFAIVSPHLTFEEVVNLQRKGEAGSNPYGGIPWEAMMSSKSMWISTKSSIYRLAYRVEEMRNMLFQVLGAISPTSVQWDELQPYLIRCSTVTSSDDVAHLRKQLQSARDKESYVDILKTQSVLSVPIHSGAWPSDGSLIQDAKDIERDAIEVNGMLYTGSSHGYKNIVASIESILMASESMSHCAASTSPKHLAQLLLRACNRTHSGGLSFELLADLFQHDVLCLSPDSSTFSPLKLTICGPLVSITVSAVYRICEIEPTHDSESVWAKIEAVYECKLHIAAPEKHCAMVYVAFVDT
eukprot:GILK01004502.1.p1 GENE.GILK01004502.1~~GILK01004502.1.p1  ORF type:complete len:362 (-),score=33.60 GILK01004502.1:76-1137(-)